MWNLCLFLCESLNVQYKIRGISVIMEIYKSLFAKVFNLRSKFNFVKGFLANVLVIITLAALVQFNPKLLRICYQKVFFFYKLEFTWTFENIFKSYDLVQVCTTWKL